MKKGLRALADGVGARLKSEEKDRDREGENDDVRSMHTVVLNKLESA
jgi:hypothetical protein